MIVKLTDEKDLFSFMETQEEQDWFNLHEFQPLSLQILGSQHMYVVGELWNNKFVGSGMWMKYKT